MNTPADVNPNSEWGKVLHRNQIIQTVSLVIIALLAAVSLALGIVNKGGQHETNKRLAGDEKTTCVIQSRGLQASPFLVGSLENLKGIVGSFTPAEKSRLPAKQFNYFFNLEYNLDRYLKITKAQPKGRVCSK